MFKYFGSKRGHSWRYPVPRYPLIIEPFAGAAGYSLGWYTRKVWLNDINPVVWDMWNWLLVATHSMIDRLPELEAGEFLSDYTLNRQERRIVGFHLNQFRPDRPANRCMPIYHGKTSAIVSFKRRAHHYCPLIRHWSVTGRDYRLIPNQEATWFIDAPYQRGGEHYPFRIRDYGALRAWCLSRKGQVIVCEGDEANWLPFRVLHEKRIIASPMVRTMKELIWTNED